MDTLRLQLVLQGKGYYTFVPGEALVMNVGSSEYERSREFIEVIVNSLRSGCRMVQLVEVHPDAIVRLWKMLDKLKLPNEGFVVEEIRAESGFGNCHISRINV